MSRPLNFLHMTTFYPPYSFGGDALYLYRLAHALGDADHHVDVIHCVDAYRLRNAAEPKIVFDDHPNVTIYSLQSPYGFLSPLLTHQTGRPYLKTPMIRRVLNSRRYDVVHFHNISLLGPTVLAMEPLAGPVLKLYSIHEHWLICPTHTLWKFNTRPCEKPACLRCTLLSMRPPQLWRYTGLVSRMTKHVDLFLSPSRFTAMTYMARDFPRPIDHLPLFIERVDQDWQDPGPRPIEKPYVLFVGRLEVIKGLQTVINVWNRVAECDLLIVGAGSYEQALWAQAASNPRIKFLGELPQRALGALYVHAVATVVPSITFEAFGTTVIEAFARKTPVIARRLGALNELITDSGGGFLYSTDDELLSAVRALASSPTLRAECGEKGYQAFTRWWSKEAHLERYFELLKKTAMAKFGHVPWEEGLVAGDASTDRELNRWPR